MKYEEVDRILKFKNGAEADRVFGPQALYILVEFRIGKADRQKKFVGYSIRKRPDEEEYTVHYNFLVQNFVARTNRWETTDHNNKMRKTLLLHRRRFIDMKSLDDIRMYIMEEYKDITSARMSFFMGMGGV